MEKNISQSPPETLEKPLVEQEPIASSTEPSPPPKPLGKKRKFLKIFIGVLIAFAVLAAGISGYWFYQEKKLKLSPQEPQVSSSTNILFMKEGNLWIMNSEGNNQELWMEGWKTEDKSLQPSYFVANDYFGLQTGENEFTISDYPDKSRTLTLSIPHYYAQMIYWPSWRDFYYRLPQEEDSSLDNHIVFDTAENKVISKVSETRDCYRLELAPNWKNFICQKENRLYLGEISNSKSLLELKIFSEKRADGKYRMPPNNDFYKIQWLSDSKIAAIFYETKDSPELSGLPDVPGPSYFNLALIDIESNNIIDFPLKVRDLIAWRFSGNDNDLYLYLYGEGNLIIWQPFQQKIKEIKNASLPKMGPDYKNMLRLKRIEGNPFLSENIEDNLIIYSAVSQEDNQTYELRVFNLKTEEDKLLAQNAFINNEFYDHDSQLIVFEKRGFEPDSATIKSQDIWTIKLDGSGLKQLTFDGKSQNPSWIKPLQIMP